MAIPTHGALFITNPRPAMKLLNNPAKNKLVAKYLGWSISDVKKLKRANSRNGERGYDEFERMFQKAGGDAALRRMRKADKSAGKKRAAAYKAKGRKKPAKKGYSVLTTKTGAKQYRKDGKLISKAAYMRRKKPAAKKPAAKKYVYEFIVKEMSPETKNFNIHITDIRADGKRVISKNIKVHQEPNHAKCNSKKGGYECKGKNYGFNDPEPASPSIKDLTWSAWKKGQGEVGTKIFTMTFPSKVTKFEIDYFRPKYTPGWTIKENGKQVLSTSKGPNKNSPNPFKVEYVIS